MQATSPKGPLRTKRESVFFASSKAVVGQPRIVALDERERECISLSSDFENRRVPSDSENQYLREHSVFPPRARQSRTRQAGASNRCLAPQATSQRGLFFASPS
jgi:hypothetical protein